MYKYLKIISGLLEAACDELSGEDYTKLIESLIKELKNYE